MQKANPSRSAEFKAACALAGVTVKQWCGSQGVTTSHLYQVMNYGRQSERLNGAVDAFIALYRRQPGPAAKDAVLVVAGGSLA